MKSREKNSPTSYTSNTPQVFTLSLGRLAAIVSGAIVTSIVGTAFAIGSSGVSDHFLLVSVSADVGRLKVETVRRDVYESDIKYIKESISEIKTDIKEIKNK